MLKQVEVWVAPIPNLLHEQRLVDVEGRLALRAALLNIRSTFGHSETIVTLSLWKSIQAYVIVTPGKVVNTLQLFFGPAVRYGST